MYQDYSREMTNEEAKELAARNIEKALLRGDSLDEAIRTETEIAWQLARIELDETDF